MNTHMVTRFFTRPQKPIVRVVPILIADAPNLVDRLDDIEAVRRLVQRSSAATVARVLRYVAAQEGQVL